MLNILYLKLYYFANLILNKYYNFKSKIFFVNDIKSKNENLFYQFYFIYYFSYFPFINYFINNKTYDLIKICYTNGILYRSSIYKNVNTRDFVTIIDGTINKKFLFDENEIMMMKKNLILDIFYKENNNNVSIKSLINNYADKNKNFINNTIKNITNIENIKIPDNKLYITSMKLIKKTTLELDITDNDIHVSDLF